MNVKEPNPTLATKPKIPLHFLHIGKTGGTAIKCALKNSLDTSKYQLCLHGHRFCLKHVPEGEKVVFFLRDPLQRFISGFNSRQRGGKPRYRSPWNTAEREAFSCFLNPNSLGLALSSEAPQQLRMAAKKAMQKIRHVNTFYWDWFDNREFFLSRIADIFFVGTQERLFSDFELLRKLIGLPPTVSLPKDEIAAHCTPRGALTNLSIQASLALQAWYKQDYEFLRLCDETIDGFRKCQEQE